MTTEKVEEETLSRADGAKEETPKTEAPAPRAPTLEKVREIESRLQSREAAANKRATQAEREVQRLTTRMQDLEAQIEEAPYGDDEEAKAAHRKLIEARTSLRQGQEALEEREGNLRASEKALAIWSLSQSYGIPVEELEELETAHEMEVKALKWALDKAPKAEAPEAKPKAPPPPSGDQTVPRKSVASMTDAEFDVHWERQKAAANKKALNR